MPNEELKWWAGVFEGGEHLPFAKTMRRSYREFECVLLRVKIALSRQRC